jgi:hypothetical protein
LGGRDPAEAVAGGGAEGGAAEGGAAERGEVEEGGAVEEEPAVIWGTERQPMHAAIESATRGGRMTPLCPFSVCCAPLMGHTRSHEART